MTSLYMENAMSWAPCILVFTQGCGQLFHMSRTGFFYGHFAMKRSQDPLPTLPIGST